jgi:quercetin dioxygenase-like cupin family protein
MAETLVRKSGEGKALWMLGGLYEVKAASEETDGSMTVMQMTLPEGMGPPPHTHSGAEAVYVIEGRLRYHIAGETHDAGPGDFFYVPEGTWENFEPVEQSRVLVIYSPSTEMDKFFAEAGEEATSREVPPAPESPPDFDNLQEIGRRYGVELREPAEA